MHTNLDSLRGQGIKDHQSARIIGINLLITKQ